jgi:hypothetical protein
MHWFICSCRHPSAARESYFQIQSSKILQLRRNGDPHVDDTEIRVINLSAASLFAICWFDSQVATQIDLDSEPFGFENCVVKCRGGGAQKCPDCQWMVKDDCCSCSERHLERDMPAAMSDRSKSGTEGTSHKKHNLKHLTFAIETSFLEPFKLKVTFVFGLIG